MIGYLATVRMLRRGGITPAAVGRDAWAAFVEDQHRRANSTLSPPTRSGPMRRIGADLLGIETQILRRRSGSQAEVARAEALGDLADLYGSCANCDGARFVRIPPVPPALIPPRVPCWECVPIATMARWAGVDRRFQDATLATFSPLEGKRAGLETARAWDGRRPVVITGLQGRGKTRLGVGMLLQAITRGADARFYYVPDLLDDLKARFGDDLEEQSQALFDRIANTPVLMLDDLGKEGGTPWAVERVSTLLDRRYRREMATIITTNLDHLELARRYSNSTADRLFEAEWIELGGVSVRKDGVK